MVDGCQPVWWTVAQVIAIKKSAKMDEQAQRWWMKCVGGPDFFIADEATGKPSYVEKKKKVAHQDFPGGTVAKTLSFQRRGPKFDPWSRN